MTTKDYLANCFRARHDINPQVRAYARRGVRQGILDVFHEENQPVSYRRSLNRWLRRQGQKPL